jgi:hypothetical protein
MVVFWGACLECWIFRMKVLVDLGMKVMKNWFVFPCVRVVSSVLRGGWRRDESRLYRGDFHAISKADGEVMNHFFTIL